jgi:uncharacterized protein (TIGR02996 family)
MSDDAGFLHAIRDNPADDTARPVYADWLDERDDPRGDFLRLHVALRSLPPDHPHRPPGNRDSASCARDSIPRGCSWSNPSESTCT